MKDGSDEFVVLEHTEAEGTHWDLMLKDGDVLLTWRLDVPPEQIGNAAVHAERIHDHPLRFLTYEGPVQKNTANVVRADTGACNWVKKDADTLAFSLDGRILMGPFQLRHARGTEWVFCKSSC